VTIDDVETSLIEGHRNRITRCERLPINYSTALLPKVVLDELDFRIGSPRWRRTVGHDQDSAITRQKTDILGRALRLYVKQRPHRRDIQKIETPRGPESRNRDHTWTTEPDAGTEVPRENCEQVTGMPDLIPRHTVETHVPVLAVAGYDVTPTVDVAEGGLREITPASGVLTVDHGVLTKPKIETDQADLASKMRAANNRVSVEETHRGRRRVATRAVRGASLGMTEVLELDLQGCAHAGHDTRRRLYPATKSTTTPHKSGVPPQPPQLAIHPTAILPTVVADHCATRGLMASARLTRGDEQ
jgi:hypothetical protein